MTASTVKGIRPDRPIMPQQRLPDFVGISGHRGLAAQLVNLLPAW